MSEAGDSNKTSDGKNIKSVKCKFCNSTILKPSCGEYVNLKFPLPMMTQSVKDEVPTTEDVFAFWEVADMFAFYNVGFTNAVDNNKYLTCADCDTGPIGYHDLTTKKCYVALCRVKHV